jgi:hypothetical protein
MAITRRCCGFLGVDQASWTRTSTGPSSLRTMPFATPPPQQNSGATRQILDRNVP